MKNSQLFFFLPDLNEEKSLTAEATVPPGIMFCQKASGFPSSNGERQVVLGVQGLLNLYKAHMGGKIHHIRKHHLASQNQGFFSCNSFPSRLNSKLHLDLRTVLSQNVACGFILACCGNLGTTYTMSHELSGCVNLDSYDLVSNQWLSIMCMVQQKSKITLKNLQDIRK